MVKYSKTTAGVFSALADETRFDIMDRLKKHGPLPVGVIASPYQMSLPAVSKHLKVLERAKLVSKTHVGQQRVYEPNQETLASFKNFIESTSLFWVGAIERMTAHVEKEHISKQNKK